MNATRSDCSTSAVEDAPLPAPAPELNLAKPEQFSHLASQPFQDIPSLPEFQVRELSVGELSGGLVGARVFRATPGYTGPRNFTFWHMHKLGIHFGMVIKGWAIFEFEGVGKVRIEPGSVMYQPAMNRHREIDMSHDFEAIEITLPAVFENIAWIPDPSSGEYQTQPFGE